MFGLGPAELIVIGVLALLFIGPKKLPELARGLGKSIKEFQRAKDEFQSEFNNDDSSNKDKTEQLGSPDEEDPMHKDVDSQPHVHTPHAAHGPEAHPEPTDLNEPDHTTENQSQEKSHKS